MRRQSLMVGALLVVLIGGGVWYLYGRGDGLMVVTEEGVIESGLDGSVGTEVDQVGNLDHEMAEFRAYSFMQDFVEVGPPEPNPEAEARVYAALSKRAKTEVSRERLSRDIAAFVGVQDVPDQGVSVEDLQVVDDENVVVVLGLNFSGGRVLREVHLVVEENEWRVDDITTPENQ